MASLIIGLIWFAWHIPLFWAPFGTLASGDAFSPLNLLSYFILITALSVIMTWLFNKSGGSVLIAILFHLSINAGLVLAFFPELMAQYQLINMLGGVSMVLFALFLVFASRSLYLKKQA